MNMTISTKPTGKNPVNFAKYSIATGERFVINPRAISPSETKLNEDNLKILKNYFSIQGGIKTKSDPKQSANSISSKNANDLTTKPLKQDNNISIKFSQSTNDSGTIRRGIDGNNYKLNSARNNSNTKEKNKNSNENNTNVCKDNKNSGNDNSKSYENMMEDQDTNTKYLMNLINDGDFVEEEVNEKEENKDRERKREQHNQSKLFGSNNQINTTSQKGDAEFKQNKGKYEEDYRNIIKKPKERYRTSKNNNVGNSSGQDNNGSSNNSNGSGSGNSHTKSHENGKSNEQNQGDKNSNQHQNTNQSSSNPSYNNLNPDIQLDENKINSLKYNLLNKNAAGNASNMPQQTPILNFGNNESNMHSNTVNTFTNPKVHNNASSSNSRESSKNSVEAAIDSENNYYMRSNILNKINSILANRSLTEKLVLYGLLSQQSNNSQFGMNNFGLSNILRFEGSFKSIVEKHFEKEIVKFTIMNFCKYLKSNGYSIVPTDKNNQKKKTCDYSDEMKTLTQKKRKRDTKEWSKESHSSKNFNDDKDNNDMDSNNNRSNMPDANLFLEQSDNSEDENSKKMKITCPHKFRKHYAKNMCNTCYHREGRVKKAWLCPHTYKPHYARGKCRNCYLNFYHKKKDIKKAEGSNNYMNVDSEVKDSQLEKN